MLTPDLAFTGVPREAEKLNGEFRPDHPFFNPLRNNPIENRSTHGSERSPSSIRAEIPSEVATASAPAATDGTRSHSGDNSASRRRKRPGDTGLQYDTNVSADRGPTEIMRAFPRRKFPSHLLHPRPLRTEPLRRADPPVRIDLAPRPPLVRRQHSPHAPAGVARTEGV